MTKPIIKLPEKYPAFFAYPFEDAAVKILANGDAFVKFKGDNEFKAEPGSALVTDAELQGDTITEREYLAFN